MQMERLANDNQLPHVFYLRAERPIYRYGIVTLALAAALLLVVVDAQTERLIPLFTIGVFIGFTISQLGLVRLWLRARPSPWRARAAINGLGATLTAIAVGVALLTKFLAGAWVVTIVISLLIVMFARTEGYYGEVAWELELGKSPAHPKKRASVVIVPVSVVDVLTDQAISAALSLGEKVAALYVAGDDKDRCKIQAAWQRWGPRRHTRGADGPSSLAGHDRAQVHSTNRGRVCTDHRPDPRSRAAQTTARDPPQPGRPAPGRCAESRNRRRRHDAAVPSARLRRVALGTFVCRRLLAGLGGMLDALDRLPGLRGGPDAVRISAAVRARLGERGRPG